MKCSDESKKIQTIRTSVPSRIKRGLTVTIKTKGSLKLKGESLYTHVKNKGPNLKMI